MNNKFSILENKSCNYVGIIDDVLFENLEINSLFRKETCSFLKNIPSADDAQKRRDFFWDIIQNESDFHEIKALSSSISDFSISCGLLDRADNDVERAFAFVSNTSSFLNIVNQIKGLFDSTLTDELKSRIADFIYKYDDIDVLYRDLKNNIEQMMRFSVLSDFSEIYERDDGQGIDVCFESLIDKLGYRQTSKKSSSVKIDNSFSDLIKEHFSDVFNNYDHFHDVIEKYIERDIIELGKDLSICINIADVFLDSKEKGIKICRPESTPDHVFKAHNIIDPTLIRVIDDTRNIVTNDVCFDTDNPVIYVMGANGGGKTTFLKAAAINLLLFMNGCPCFCSDAEIYNFTDISVFFSKEEKGFSDGRFYEEKKIIDDLVSKANERSVLFFNEAFNSTGENNADSLLYELSQAIKEKGAFALFVTHFVNTDLSGINALYVGKYGDGNENSYRVLPVKDAICALTDDILRKYGLDRESLMIGEQK